MGANTSSRASVSETQALTVRLFAERAAMLVRHPDRLGSLL